MLVRIFQVYYMYCYPQAFLSKLAYVYHVKRIFDGIAVYAVYSLNDSWILKIKGLSQSGTDIFTLRTLK